MLYPKNEGFYFPPEWHPHEAMWLSFPKNLDTWEDRLERIYPAYFEFIKTVSASERVCINVDNESLKTFIETKLNIYGIDKEKVSLFLHATNDSWCRDHGPAFLINRHSDERMIVDWEYNAWGGKYPPFNSDNDIPNKIAKLLKLPKMSPGIIMEGGSVEFNGNGSILTSKSCLLNKNRNPHLNQKEIESYLLNYYGAEQILWIEDGIVGDDTDGHVDDTTRFVNEETVLTAMETNRLDDNYDILKENLSLLKKMRLVNGKKLEIIELPMPDPILDSNERLPASYANFYISNDAVVVPIYNCKKDDIALKIIGECFKNRRVVGIDSREIIWGLGSFHCLSQQEPKANIFIKN